MYSENTHLKGETSTVGLTSCLDGLFLTRQVNLLLFNNCKSAESKQVKQDLSNTFPVSEYSMLKLI